VETADPNNVSEKVYQTWERVTQMKWPGGKHPLVFLFLKLFYVTERPGSAGANLRLQECLMFVSSKGIS
jgi:hypothetical protein